MEIYGDGKDITLELIKKYNQQEKAYATANADGQIIIPDEIKKVLGWANGARFKIVVEGDRIELYPNIHSLAKVYIEPTSLCNLNCKTCLRNTWEEPMGDMDLAIFDRLVEQLKEFDCLQSVMFGGFGEPTFHKDILYMIACLKSLGIKVEMVTNGTLLSKNMIEGLRDSKLDTLWVSFDGTNEHDFEDIRKGANFKKVVNNLLELKEMNDKSHHTILVGVSFVLCKDNVNNLSYLNEFAQHIGAVAVKITNVLPYTKDMVSQMLCNLAILDYSPECLSSSVKVSLPLLDVNNVTKNPLCDLLMQNKNISIMQNQVGTETLRCKFITERCTFIRWDGKVCPCMGLLHSFTTYISYMDVRISERKTAPYILGDISRETLLNIWNSPEYRSFREKVDAFDFAPCYICGGCDLSHNNEEDCYGNSFPVCSACLWAHGVIQCP
jgi:MoaA/NifB/PqqE/SkfB family radical SAM enzyme